MSILHVFADTSASCRALAQDMVHWLQERPGDLHLALSGGNTPLRLYAILAGETRIPWQRIHLWWVDERLLPPADPRSNYGAARSVLLDPLRLPLARIHRIHGERTPEQAAKDYDRELDHLAGGASHPAFDLVLLGVGDDGHTASLFPDAEPEWTGRHSLRVCHPSDGTLRVSLSEAVLLCAARTAFLVSGSAKRPIMAQILSGAAPGLPASRIMAAAREVHCYLDAAATGKPATSSASSASSAKD